MKISEIIELLELIKEEHGNKEFWIFNDTFGDHKAYSIKVGQNKLNKTVVYFDHDDKEDSLDIEYTLRNLNTAKKAS
jgi:aspartate/tyrosine/aromatic aminotransferase